MGRTGYCLAISFISLPNVPLTFLLFSLKVKAVSIFKSWAMYSGLTVECVEVYGNLS